MITENDSQKVEETPPSPKKASQSRGKLVNLLKSIHPSTALLMIPPAGKRASLFPPQTHPESILQESFPMELLIMISIELKRKG